MEYQYFVCVHTSSATDTSASETSTSTANIALSNELLVLAKSNAELQQECEKVTEPTSDDTLGGEVWLGVISFLLAHHKSVVELSKLILSFLLNKRKQGETFEDITITVKHASGKRVEFSAKQANKSTVDEVLNEILRLSGEVSSS